MKKPWSAWAWIALAVGIIAGLALPGRILWDIAAVVLALVARHEICGDLSWSLTAKQPRKRGVWLANIAFLIGGLDVLFIGFYSC